MRGPLAAAFVVSVVLGYSGAFKVAAVHSFRATWMFRSQLGRRLLAVLPPVEIALGALVPFYRAARITAVGLFAVLLIGRVLPRRAMSSPCNCGAPGLSRLPAKAGNLYVLALAAAAGLASISFERS